MLLEQAGDSLRGCLKVTSEGSGHVIGRIPFGILDILATCKHVIPGEADI